MVKHLSLFIHASQRIFLKKIKFIFIFLLQIIFIFVFYIILNYFDVLILKLFFFKNTYYDNTNRFLISLNSCTF